MPILSRAAHQVPNSAMDPTQDIRRDSIEKLLLEFELLSGGVGVNQEDKASAIGRYLPRKIDGLRQSLTERGQLFILDRDRELIETDRRMGLTVVGELKGQVGEGIVRGDG